MQGRCDKHQFEAAENICRTCGGEFCAECLVYSFGPKKPPYCIACALAAAGVRTTAGNRPVKDKKEIKKDTKARRKAEKAAKKEGVPTVEIDWAVPSDPTDGVSEDELMLPTEATAAAAAANPVPPPPPTPSNIAPPAPAGANIEPGFVTPTPPPPTPAEHLLNAPDAFAPTPPPPTPAEPPQHLLRGGQPPLPAAPPAPPPLTVQPPPAPPMPQTPVAPGGEPLTARQRTPAPTPPPAPPAPAAPAAPAAPTPPPAPDLFAEPAAPAPGDALAPSSFGLDESLFDPIPTPARPPTPKDVEGRSEDVPPNWPNA